MNNKDNAQDDPRDAHLLAALRHAPDRDAVPPREVSERILAAARAAVRAAREPRAPWWQRWSAWLTQPQVAAAFGTLVVASLVGVMWSTREPPVPEFVPPPPSADRAEQGAIAPTPAAAPEADAAKPEASSVTAAPAAAGEVRPKIAQAARPKTPPSGVDTAARAESRSRAMADAPPAPAAATTPATPAPAPALRAADAAAPAAAAERRSANENESQVLARQQGAAAIGRSSAAAGLSSAAKARAADPLAGIDAALAAGARWQAPELADGRQHGEAQRAFWASVKEATQGHWAAVQAPSPFVPWLVLEQDSRVANLWIINGALYISAEGQSWRAPVDAAKLADWQAQVARW